MKEQNNEAKAGKSTGRKVLKIVLNVLIWTFVAFSVVVTILAFAAQGDADGIPTIGQTSFFSVTTNSMEPTIMQGDLIISKKFTSDAEKQNLKVDDIITFKMVIAGENAFNTHRIIEVRGTGNETVYITKGDNKEANVGNVTETVPYNLVVRKYNDTRIPGIGSFLAFLQTPNGFLIVIVIPLVLFFLFELVKFIRAAIAVKNEGKKQITAADEELIKQKAVEEYLRQQKEKEKEEAEKQQQAEDTKPEDAKPEEPKPEEPREDRPFEPTAEQPEVPGTEQADLIAAESAGAVKEAAEEKAEEIAEEAAEIREEAAEAVESATEAAEEVKEEAAEAVETATETAEEVKKEASEAVETATEAAEEVKDEAAEAVETATEAAEEIKDEAAEAVETAAEAAQTAAEECAEKAEKTAEETAEEAVSDLLHKADNE